LAALADGQAHADALNQAQPDQFTPHEGHFTHEAVAGAAAVAPSIFRCAAESEAVLCTPGS